MFRISVPRANTRIGFTVMCAICAKTQNFLHERPILQSGTELIISEGSRRNKEKGPAGILKRMNTLVKMRLCRIKRRLNTMNPPGAWFALQIKQISFICLSY